VDWLIERARVLTLHDGRPGPAAGAAQGEIGGIGEGVVAVHDGRIHAVGAVDIARDLRPRRLLDAGGRVVMPGLVDAHTHPLWAGDRVAEFEMRVAGRTYLDIMAAGGGIASTVRATRAAGDAQLLDLLLERLDRFAAHGTTTVEAKTGYGLAVDEELRHMRLLAEGDARHPVHVVPTFLGAHALPDEFAGRPDEYVDLVIGAMLPSVAERYPGGFCDVFCDQGAFTRAQTERILRRARELGLRLKVHSDEFANLGCTALAAALGAASADHLAETRPEEMDALAAAGTVAVLLPGTTFGLGSNHYAKGREFVGRGVPVALGTDYNPGTCPCESLAFMMALATRYMGLSPAEALVAVTRNAACAVGRGDRAGRLVEGWPADLLILETDDYRDLAYRFGASPVHAVMIGGRWLQPTAPAGPPPPTSSQ